MIRFAYALMIALVVAALGCSDSPRRTLDADGGEEPSGDGAQQQPDGSTSPGDGGAESDASGRADPDASTSEQDAGGGGGNGGTAGNGKVGQPCRDASDCTMPSGAECYTDEGGYNWPGGYCSKACDATGGNDQCGDGASCVGSGSGGGGSGSSFEFCGQRCETDEDCRKSEGYTCNTLPVLGLGFCAPPSL
jgi:hypothetical protein